MQVLCLQVLTQHLWVLSQKGYTLAFLSSFPAPSRSIVYDSKDSRRRRHMRLAQCLGPTKIEKQSLKGATNAKHRTIICKYSSIVCNERKKEKKKKHCKQYTYSSTGMNKLTCIYTMGNFAILNKKNELDLYMLSCRP